MNRRKFVLTLLVIGTMCAVIVSCGNNSNKPSEPQITNNETTTMIDGVEWENENTKVSTQNNNANMPQDIKIGDPELVKYENISVHKDFSFACYPLSDIINDTKTFSFDFDNDGTSESVVIQYSPNRLKVLGNSKKTGLVIMDLEGSVLDDLEPEYIQVSAYDFDDDGIFEMILSVGNGILENMHSLFRINSSDGFGFDIVEVIHSQQDIILNKNEIEAPYGFQGMIELYEYKNGRIIEIQ